jgi:hypothetical protein
MSAGKNDGDPAIETPFEVSSRTKRRRGERGGAPRRGRVRKGRNEDDGGGARSGRPVQLFTTAFLAAEEARLGVERRRPRTALPPQAGSTLGSPWAIRSTTRSLRFFRSAPRRTVG